MSTALAIRGEISDAPLPQKMNGGGIGELLHNDAVRMRLEPLLPEGVEYRQVIAQAQLAALKDPKILSCTVSSVVHSVGEAMRLGLDIGTTAHLVPFGNTLTFIADYKGLIQLMIASGAVRDVDANVVYEKDEFSCSYGTGGEIRHSPWGDYRTRGKPVGAYAIFYLPFGRAKWRFMPLGDKETEGTIEYIRQRYSKQWKGGECPGWYMIKTAIRQFSKLVPRTPKLAKVFAALEADAQEEFGELDVPHGVADTNDIPQAPRLMSGDAEPTPEPAPNRPANITADGEEIAAEDVRMPIGHSKGKRLGDIETKDLEGAAKWCREKGKFSDLVENIGVVLANRAAEMERVQPSLELTPDIAWPAITEKSPEELLGKATPSQLGKRIDALLQHPACTTAIDTVREKLKAPKTTKDIRRLVEMLETTIYTHLNPPAEKKAAAKASVPKENDPAVIEEEDDGLPF